MMRTIATILLSALLLTGCSRKRAALHYFNKITSFVEKAPKLRAVYDNKIETAIITGDTFTPETLFSGRAYLIYYTDASGTTWNALPNGGDTPFSVTVTKRTVTNVQGTFSGTVSDNAGTPGGNLKIITEGTFSVPIQ